MKYIAVLTEGLPESSRVMKAVTGQSYETNTRLMALIIDMIQNYIWLRLGKQGDEPQSLYKVMTTKNDTESYGFDSVEDFNNARQAILNG